MNELEKILVKKNKIHFFHHYFKSGASISLEVDLSCKMVKIKTLPPFNVTEKDLSEYIYFLRFISQTLINNYCSPEQILQIAKNGLNSLVSK